MNLVLCVEAYFGRLADETVAPILYRDGSSYERMSATWTDERPLPSEAELVAYWEQTGEALVQAWQAPEISTDERLAMLESVVEALVMQNLQLQAQIDGGGA